MMMGRARIEAVTVDFYNTLVFHRDGTGRSRRLAQYLAASGYESPAWHDGAIYRVLEHHAREYAPELPEDTRDRYLQRLAHRVFDEIGQRVSEDEARRHAGPIWEILGPASFAVFPDVFATLECLRTRALKLAVISNWHCGVEHYIAELGMRPYFEHVIGSADCGFEKPDRRIFEKASAVLRVPPNQILHVGDSYEQDYSASLSAGFEAVLVEREVGGQPRTARVVRRLSDLCLLPEFAPSHTTGTLTST